MKFYTVTLGCKVNQYETQAIANILVSRGHEQTGKQEESDVCLVNTCAVTAESARKSRQAVRRVKKAAPGALTAVCGCLSQLEPAAAAELGADLVGGSGDRYGFALEVERLFEEKQPGVSGGGNARTSAAAKVIVDDPEKRVLFEETPPGAARQIETGEAASRHGRTRALLKIQDGCDNRCAYCVIPNARGQARSLPPERAAEHARILAKQGFREIVITGIEISSYGAGLAGNTSLTDVVRRISAAAPGARLRLGSLDPRIMTGEFCRELSGFENLCDHFHLSLQSGCDDTLIRMGRGYGTDKVTEAASSLRGLFPDCGITADLIVGFPGETEDEFERTLGFIRSVSFSDMHIFPFSARPGTRAASMPGQIEKKVISERARAAAAVAADMAGGFRRGMIGKTAEVLFERERGGYWTGHSGSYVEVAAESGGSKNAVGRLLITRAEDGRVWGRPLGNSRHPAYP